MRISLMDFVNLEKELKKIFKSRNHIIKKKKKKLYTCNMYFYCIIRCIIFSQEFCLEIIMHFKLQFNL